MTHSVSRRSVVHFGSVAHVGLPLWIAAAALAGCSTDPSLRQGTEALATCAILSPVEGASLTAADDVDPMRADIQVNVSVGVRNAAAGDALELFVDGARRGPAQTLGEGASTAQFAQVSLPRGPVTAGISCRIAGRESRSPTVIAVGESCGLRFANPAQGATVSRSQTRPGPDGRPIYSVVMESAGLPDGTPVSVEVGDFGVAQFAAQTVIARGRAALDVPLLPGIAHLRAEGRSDACAPVADVRFLVELGACSVSLRAPPSFNASMDTSSAPGLQTRVCVATDCAEGAQAALRIEGSSELTGTVVAGQACFEVSIPEGSRSITARVNAVTQSGIAPPLRTCVDVTPPIVTLSYPPEGLVVGSRDDVAPSPAAFELRVAGVAASLSNSACEPRVGASRVEVRVNGQTQERILQASDGPFERVVTLSPGPNRVQACAYDSASNVSCTPAVNVMVELALPTLRFTTPDNGALIGVGGGKEGAPAPILVQLAAWKVDAGVVVALRDDKSDWRCERRTEVQGRSVMVGFSLGDACARLPDGVHSLRASTVDALGNAVLSPPLLIEIDSVPPSLEFTSPQNGEAHARERLDVMVRTDLEPGSPVELRVDDRLVIPGVVSEGGGILYPQVPLVEGDNELAVTGRDRAGNSTTTRIRVERDTLVPAPSFSDLVGGRVYGVEDDRDGFAANGFQRDVRIIVAGEPDGVVAELTVNDNSPLRAVVNAGTALFRAVTLAEGANSLLARVRDRAGQVGQANVSFFVRTGAPRVELTTPEPGRIFAAADDIDPATEGVQIPWRMEVSLSPLPAVCELVVDSGLPAERHLTFQPNGFVCEGVVTLSEGDHTLQGRIAAARPGASVAVMVRVDTRAPILTLVSPNAQTLNGSAIDSDGRPGFQSDVVIAADDIEAGQLATLRVTPDTTGVAVVYNAAFDDAGRAVFRAVTFGDVSANTLEIVASDAAGNAATPISSRLIVDREAPTVSFVTPVANARLGIADDESAAPGFQRSVAVLVSGVELGHTVQLTVSAGKGGQSSTFTSAPIDPGSEVVTFAGITFPAAVSGERYVLRTVVSDSAGNAASAEIETSLGANEW